MIKAILLATGIVAFASTVAEAQQRQYNRNGYSQSYRGGNNYRNNGNRYVQNNYYGGRGYRGYGGGGWNNGGAIAAGVGLGLIGGLIAGSVINQPAYAYPAPVYPVAPVVTGCVRQYVTLPNGQVVLANVCP